MAEMMKEVVVVEPHKYEVREVEIPELANEDEVLIQMKSAGVCGSDHHIWHGSNVIYMVQSSSLQSLTFLLAF